MTDHINRRHALSLLTACGLSFALPGMLARAANRRREERPKSLITLWMNGGMSQLETWDPHSGTPSGGEVKSINTSLPGVQVSEFLPQMAQQMHDVTLIRSLTSLEGDHARGAAFVKTGYRLDPTLVYPSLGSIAAHELRDPRVEIPQHVSLGGDDFFPRGGYLGNEWDAFRVFDPGRSLTNLDAGVSDERLNQRRRGLDVVTEQFAKGRPTSDRNTLHSDTIRRALKMMSSEQLNAFQLDDEPKAVRQAYGDSRFGRGCLIARRLVEVGVRSIEVCLNGFDTHANNHAGQKANADILDPAFATLLTELRDRDLLDSTVVLCISEFGRTPSINPAGGRDHWPHWFSGVVAGGGFQQGLVVGETPSTVSSDDEQAAAKQKPKPVSPITIPELYATIMQTMGIDGQKEIITPIGRPMRFVDADPVMRLLKDNVLQQRSGV
ncbi:MAG: DUF1501 domain-containing protein [Planctomycetaceae bacterium]